MKKLLTLLLLSPLAFAEEIESKAFYCEIKEDYTPDFFIKNCPLGSVLFYSVTEESINRPGKLAGYSKHPKEFIEYAFELLASNFIAQHCDFSNQIISKTIGDDELRHQVLCTKSESREVIESPINFGNLLQDSNKDE